MLTIDADAHVIECEKTWDYLEGDDKRYRPVAIAVDMPTGKTQNFWIIGGRLIGGRDNIGQDTSKESREMANIDSRLKHMDDIGTGVQVLYPTLFLRPVTDNPRIELALCRSYNRWMADIWSKDKKRLRWAVQLPLMTMDKALDELRWSQVVRPGARLTVTREVVDLRRSRSNPRNGLVRTRITAANQAGETVLSMVSTGMIAARSDG